MAAHGVSQCREEARYASGKPTTTETEMRLKQREVVPQGGRTSV